MNAKDLFGHWIDVRNGLFQALDKLTDSQLAFTPRQGLWSLQETACHIAGAEEGWFRYIVTHELSGWAEADFKAANYPTITALKTLLTEVHARTEALFTNDADTTMRQKIKLPYGPEMTIEEVVWHVLEHEIHHRGEIYLILGLQGIEAPDV
jgi:uncharacterized damage-inducible protein DinB